MIIILILGNICSLTFVLTNDDDTNRIPVVRYWLPVKSIAKAFGQVRLPVTRVSRAGLITDER